MKTLSPLCQSEYSVSASFTFVRDILCIENHNYVMASFGIVSLFTCIPVDEDYNRITSKTFNNSETFCGCSKMLFKHIFVIYCKGNSFIFNDKLYKQPDGAPTFMGGCVSPTLAEIFMSHYETVPQSSNLCYIDVM